MTRPYVTTPFCRLCHGYNLTPLFSLGEQHVSDFVDKDKIHSPPKVPIDIVLCPRCKLAQQLHTASKELLWKNHYWYRSGTTDTMKLALRDITSSIEGMIDLKAGDVVLDIGSNDGTLLRSYKKRGLKRIGVEPADNLQETGACGLDLLIHDFWDYGIFKLNVKKPAKVITAIGMFYDLENPGRFMADVASALDPDGIFVAQLMTLRNMINLGDVGNLCHEHIEFYSLRSLEYMFDRYGMEMIDIQTNDVNGQSDRIYARLKGGGVNASTEGQKNLAAVHQAEVNLMVPQYYRQFFDRAQENKRLCVEFIKERADEYVIWVYGASTKGNTILQWYQLDYPTIMGAADKSAEKVGKYTVGTGIPIRSCEEIAKHDPGYMLVLPYAFLNEFERREKDWRRGGGQWIVPLPEFKVI